MEQFSHEIFIYTFLHLYILYVIPCCNVHNILEDSEAEKVIKKAIHQGRNQLDQTELDLLLANVHNYLYANPYVFCNL